MIVGSARWSAPVAAQDEGLGAGGRQGGEDGSAGSLPMAQNEGIGAGGRQGGDDSGGRRRRNRDDDEAPSGVGASGRSTTDPTVMAMPKTGTGIMDDSATSAAELGSHPCCSLRERWEPASMALKRRTSLATNSRDQCGWTHPEVCDLSEGVRHLGRASLSRARDGGSPTWQNLRGRRYRQRVLEFALETSVR